MNQNPGTNYFWPLNENVKISLTDEFGFATVASCVGDPNTVALDFDTYSVGCQMTRKDVSSGNNIYYNQGTLGSPNWVISGGGSGGTLTAEIPTGTIDGTNTDFIVTATPVLFYWNGQLQNPLISPPDYVYDSLTMTITMTTAPSPGDNLLSYHQ